MLWIHPSLQLIATLLGVYAMYLGTDRFLAQHVGMKRQFKWNLHVTIGRVVIILWMAGLIGGLAIAKLKWNANFVTGLHYKTAFAMFPLMVIGAVTGMFMDRKKAQRTLLPLIHGVCNTILLVLALFQIWTGWKVIKDFIL